MLFVIRGRDAVEWSFGYVTPWAGGGQEAIDALQATTRMQHTSGLNLSTLNIGEVIDENQDMSLPLLANTPSPVRPTVAVHFCR